MGFLPNTAAKSAYILSDGTIEHTSKVAMSEEAR